MTEASASHFFFGISSFFLFLTPGCLAVRLRRVYAYLKAKQPTSPTVHTLWPDCLMYTCKAVRLCVRRSPSRGLSLPMLHRRHTSPALTLPLIIIINIINTIFILRSLEQCNRNTNNKKHTKPRFTELAASPRLVPGQARSAQSHGAHTHPYTARSRHNTITLLH